MIPHFLTTILFGFVLTTAARGEAPNPKVDAVRSSDPAGELASRAIIEAWASKKVLAGAEVGVAARCVDDGRWIASQGALTGMNPASGTKVLTTMAALQRFPVDHVLVTEVRGDIGTGGVVSGDVVLIGAGDPQLMPKHLKVIAAQMKDAGVTRIMGDMVVDGRLFDATLLPPAFDQKTTDAAYRPSIGAAGTNYGAVVIGVRPGGKRGQRAKVQVSPANRYVDVQVGAKTVKGSRNHAITVQSQPRVDGGTRVHVGGSIGVRAKALSVRKRVTSPDLLAGSVLAAFLRDIGITTEGRVRAANSDVESADELAGRAVLASHASRPMLDLLRDLNTWSNNSMAETVFKLLGERPGAPASWQAAQAYVSETLLALGLKDAEFRVRNGSGLYDATKISAAGFVTALITMGRDAARAGPLRDSLAVAAKTGTLKHRFKETPLAGKLVGKTGTLDTVASLVGFAPTKSGCEMAFAVFVNGARKKDTRALRRAIDALIVQLAALE